MPMEARGIVSSVVVGVTDAVICLTWVLGIELRSSGRVVNILTAEPSLQLPWDCLIVTYLLILSEI